MTTTGAAGSAKVKTKTMTTIEIKNLANEIKAIAAKEEKAYEAFENSIANGENTAELEKEWDALYAKRYSMTDVLDESLATLCGMAKNMMWKIYHSDETIF